MIAVYADKRGEKYRLFVKGHAGVGEKASLVCAAVSALTGALLTYTRRSPRCWAKRLLENEGEIYLSCRGGLRGAFDMTLLALEVLAVSYPENFYPILREKEEDGTVRWYNAVGCGAKSVPAPYHER